MNMKQAIRAPLRRLGWDLRKVDEKPELIDFLESRQVDVLLDVGANEGQFATLMREKGYRGEIHSFEPVSFAYAALTERITRTGDEKWTATKVAVGASNQNLPINVADLTVFSSFMPLSEQGKAFDEAAVAHHQELVSMETLDSLWRPEWDGRKVFLKVDTQGYEENVLLGAIRALHRLVGVQMELPVVNLYSGTWSIEEALTFMGETGFVPAQIHSGNHHLEDKVSLIEVDVVFRRFNGNVDA